MRRLVPLLVVLALAVLVPLAVSLAVVPQAGAHPPAEPLCGGCTEGFEDAAADHDTYVHVSHSELDVRVHENATVTGVARIRVNSLAAERFRENASLLDAVARDAFTGREGGGHAGHSPIRNVESLDASVDGHTVRVAFELPDAARTGVGDVVYTDLLGRDVSGGISLDVNATRFEGPDGTVVSRVPDGGSTDGATAAWRADEDEFLASEGYVAWSRGGVAGTAATEAAIWLGEATTEYPRVTVESVLAVVIAGSLAALLVLAGPRLDAVLSVSPHAVAVGYAGLAAFSLVVAVVAALSEAFWLGFAVLSLVPGAVVPAGALAVLSVATDDVPAVLDAVPSSVLYAIPVLTAVALVVVVANAPVVALGTASWALVLVCALGVASTRGLGPTVAVGSALALAPVNLAFVGVAGIGAQTGGALLLWVLLVALAGIPLFALGRQSALAGDGRDAKGTGDGSATGEAASTRAGHRR